VRRKILGVFLVVVLAVALLVGACAAPEPEAPAPEAPAPEAPAPEAPAPEAPAPEAPAPEAPTPAPSAEVIEWKFITELTSPEEAVAKTMYLPAVDLVESMAGGRLTVEVFYRGMVVPSGDEVYAVQEGIGEIGTQNPAMYGEVVPYAGIMAMRAGGLTARQARLWALPGMPGFDFYETFWADNFGVQYVSDLGRTHAETWAMTNVPLEGQADLQGLKFRAFGDPAIILDEMGVATCYVHGGEIYESMMRGVIDAFEYVSPSHNWDMGFQEVADYMYEDDSRAPTGSGSVFVNQAAWDALPTDLQDVLRAGFQAAEERQLANQIIGISAAVQNFIDYGTVVDRLPQSIHDAFIAAALVFYADVADADATGYTWEVLNAQEAFKTMCEIQGIS